MITYGRFLCASVLMTTLLLLATPSPACTLFAMRSAGGQVCGQNLDWPVGTGAVFVNPRGLVRRAGSQPAEPDFGARPGYVWTARYGSLTFNMFGDGLPLGGMNEAGLVVAQSSYSLSVHPRASAIVLNEFEWMQYVLDNCATVAEATATLQSISIAPVLAKVHYLVCDRAGGAAVVEFIDGRLLTYSGPDLPVPALANNSYASSLEYLYAHAGFGGDRSAAAGAASPDRFVRVAKSLRDTLAQASTPPATRAFAILDSVSQSDTRWSIVYDQAAAAVMFRTDFFAGTAGIELRDIDFDADSVRLLRLDGIALADQLPEFVDCTSDRNRRLLRDALAGHVKAAEMTKDQAADAERMLRTTSSHKAPEEHLPARVSTGITDGSRIRLKLTGETGQLAGTVTSLDESTLILLIDDSPRTVRRDRIESAEISMGRRSRFRKTLIGAGIGAVFGVALGLDSGDDPDDMWFAMSAEDKAGVGGVFFGLMGALVGAVLPPGEKWQQTTFGGVELSSRPVPGGGFGVVTVVTF